MEDLNLKKEQVCPRDFRLFCIDGTLVGGCLLLTFAEYATAMEGMKLFFAKLVYGV